jgi:peptidoglycan/xylan/chitin deacetylase (PgdA/CDA1 family)
MVGPRKQLANVIHRSGLWRLFPSGPLVLCYHGIIESIQDPWLEFVYFSLRQFRKHLDFFRKHRVVVGLDEMLSCLAEGRTPDPRFVSLCFDDALASFLDRAAPELVARKIPFAVGVPAGIPDTGRSLWEYEIGFLVYLLDCKRLLANSVREMAFICSNALVRSPRPEKRATRPAFVWEGDRAQVLRDMQRFFRDSVPSDQRVSLLDQLIREFQPDLHEELSEDGRFRVMRWDQLREISCAGGYLAAHGYLHHPHNTTLTDSCRLREFRSSLKEIERNTGQATDCFIWPEGVSDLTSITIGVDNGYKFFISNRPGFISADTSPKDVPRVSGEWPLPQLLWNAIGLA